MERRKLSDSKKDIECPECHKDIKGIDRESHVVQHWGEKWKDNVKEDSEAMKRIRKLLGGKD